MRPTKDAVKLSRHWVFQFLSGMRRRLSRGWNRRWVLPFNSFLGCDSRLYKTFGRTRFWLLSIPFWDATAAPPAAPNTPESTFNSFLGCDLSGKLASIKEKNKVFQFLSGMRQSVLNNNKEIDSDFQFLSGMRQNILKHFFDAFLIIFQFLSGMRPQKLRQKQLNPQTPLSIPFWDATQFP